MVCDRASVDCRLPFLHATRFRIDTIRDAARSRSTTSAVRTPLVPLGRLDSGRPGDLPEARNAAADRLVQDRGAYNAVRRLTPEQSRDGVWTVSAGNAAQGVALAARQAGVPCSVMVMDTAPEPSCAPSTASARRSSRRRTTSAGGRSKTTRPTAMPATSCTRSTTTTSSAATERRGSRSSRTCPTWTRSSPRGRRRPARRDWRRLARAATRRRRLRRRAGNGGAAEAVDGNGKASRFEEWTASFVDGAGGKSVLETMWPLLHEYVHESFVVSLDEAAQAMKLVAERARVIAKGAAACAVAAALRRRWRRVDTGAWSPSSRAAMSISRSLPSW